MDVIFLFIIYVLLLFCFLAFYFSQNARILINFRKFEIKVLYRQIAIGFKLFNIRSFFGSQKLFFTSNCENIAIMNELGSYIIITQVNREKEVSILI